MLNLGESFRKRLGYPSINGGEVDEALDTMEARLRTLNAFAIAVQGGSYPHDPQEDLSNGIQALYADWIRFRRESLPEALRIAVKDGTIRLELLGEEEGSGHG